MVAKNSIKKECLWVFIISFIFIFFMMYIYPMFVEIKYPLKAGENIFYVFFGLLIIYLGIRKFIIKRFNLFL